MLKWTDVQILVGLFGHLTSPEAVDVELGSMVYDVAGEKRRDVDVTITVRDPAGGATVVRGLEVKAEKDPLDISVVEGLIAKFRDMPSLTAPAIVSASGFTSGAKKKATFYGVRLLDLVPWTSARRVFPHLREDFKFCIHETRYAWADGISAVLLLKAEPNATLEPAALIVRTDGSVFGTADDLAAAYAGPALDQEWSTGRHERRGARPPNDPPEHAKVLMTFSPEKPRALLKNRLVDVEGIIFEGDVVSTVRESEIYPRVLIDSSTEEPIVACAAGETTFGSLFGIAFTERADQFTHFELPIALRNLKAIRHERVEPPKQLLIRRS